MSQLTQPPPVPREPKKYARTGPKRVWLAALLVVLFSGSYAAWWTYLAEEVEAQADQWVEARRAEGFDISFANLKVDGFPLDVRMSVSELSVGLSNGRGWSWATENLTISLKPWLLNKAAFRLGDRHAWSFRERTRQRRYQGTSESWSGRIELRNGRAQALSSLVGGLKVTEPAVSDETNLAELNIRIDRLAEPEPGFYLRLRDLILPKSIKSPLGPAVQHLDAKGFLTGEVTGAHWPELLAGWRDSGGALEFDRLDLDYRPLRLRSSGAMALDADMQPVAAFSTKTEGVFEVIDVLRREGIIPLGASVAAKVGLGLLSKTPENGGETFVEAPLTLQNRTLFMGNIKLLHVPHVRW